MNKGGAAKLGIERFPAAVRPKIRERAVKSAEDTYYEKLTLSSPQALLAMHLRQRGPTSLVGHNTFASMKTALDSQIHKGRRCGRFHRGFTMTGARSSRFLEISG
jgi:hypothetical protein